MMKFRYSFDQVMDEYAIRVFTLLDQANRLDANDKRQLILISRIANADEKSFDELYETYNEISNDPFEIMDRGSDYDKLMSLFGG